MRSLQFLTLAFLVPLAAAVTACAEPEPAPFDESATVADAAVSTEELERFEQTFVAAYDAGDASALAALWAEDGKLAMPMMPTLDRAGIEEMYAAQFAEAPGSALQVNREGIVASGDRAAAWGGFVVTGPGTDGAEWSASGRYGSVVQRQADGSWKLFRHMFNWESPPPGFESAAS